jgi:hypothetical protein
MAEIEIEVFKIAERYAPEAIGNLSPDNLNLALILLEEHENIQRTGGGIHWPCSPCEGLGGPAWECYSARPQIEGSLPWIFGYGRTPQEAVDDRVAKINAYLSMKSMRDDEQDVLSSGSQFQPE